MNREILFRGKRLDNGEWVEGFLNNRFECMILTHRICNTLDVIHFNTHKVDPETVSQYTGLKDKNGVMIFENSIGNYRFSRYKTLHNCKIQYIKNAFCIVSADMVLTDWNSIGFTCLYFTK